MSENANRDMPTPIPIKLIEDTARELMARAAIDFPRTIARVCGATSLPRYYVVCRRHACGGGRRFDTVKKP